MTDNWIAPTPHNLVAQGDGFYVSYNPVDVRDYGDVTTALVWGQMEAFYILNGNHLNAYKDLIPQGWAACFSYFKERQEDWNHRTDTGSPEVVKAKFQALLDRTEAAQRRSK